MVGLIKYLKPYRMYMVFVIFLTLASTLLELYLPTLMADVIDVGIVNSDMGYILQTGGWMIFVSILAVVCTIFVTYFANRVAVGFSRDVRKMMFTNVESFSLEEFDKIGSAS